MDASLQKQMDRGTASGATSGARPTAAQARYLKHGLEQPGGKLPLFDRDGQRISPRTIRSCLKAGWAERWYRNPVQPDWLVCKITDRGRKAVNRSST